MVHHGVMPEGEIDSYAAAFITLDLERIIADNVKVVKEGAGEIAATNLAVGDIENVDMVQNAGSVTLSGAADSQIGGCSSATNGDRKVHQLEGLRRERLQRRHKGLNPARRTYGVREKMY